MPITKKQGAIFAIYADSPIKSAAPSTSAAVSPSKRSSRKPLVSTSNIVSRKVLDDKSGAVKGKSEMTVSKAEIRMEDDLKTDTTRSRSADHLKSMSRPAKIANGGSTLAAARTVTVKRPGDVVPSSRLVVYADIPAPPPMVSAPAEMDRPSPGCSKSRPTASHSVSGSQTTPPHASTSAALDSPASRTRSKTRAAATDVAANTSPTVKRTLSMRTSHSIEVYHDEPLPHFSPRPKARPAARAPARPPLAEKSPKKIAEGVPKAVSPGKKGRWVQGDGPLVDVSEAYGASGEAPAGFAEQRL